MKQSKSNRLVGIDLCRGLAAFAVILVHSGDETWGLPISDQAISFRHLFYYAVPFFLAASFYFGTRKSPLVITTSFWQKKLQRILIPYGLWSIAYILAKAGLLFLAHEPSQIPELLADPIAIIFMGAASYHLYFLPLLLSGTFLLYLANYFNRRSASLLALSVVMMISIVIYQLLISSGNDFDLGYYTAGQDLLIAIDSSSLLYQPMRIALVSCAWIIRCFPYFCGALLLNRILRDYGSRWLSYRVMIGVLLALFLLIDVAGGRYLPLAVKDILIAYSLLLLGIAISRYLKPYGWLASLGACSFGIYLIHPLTLSVIEIMLPKLTPQIIQSVSINSMLLYSIPSFFLSWLVVALMKKNQLIAQYT